MISQDTEDKYYLYLTLQGYYYSCYTGVQAQGFAHPRQMLDLWTIPLAPKAYFVCRIFSPGS